LIASSTQSLAWLTETVEVFEDIESLERHKSLHAQVHTFSLQNHTNFYLVVMVTLTKICQKRCFFMMLVFSRVKHLLCLHWHAHDHMVSRNNKTRKEKKNQKEQHEKMMLRVLLFASAHRLKE
jgi:hypothetical protein